MAEQQKERPTRAPVVKMEDIMTATVHCATPEMTVREVIGLITGHKISGVPVVDKMNCVLSVISEGDLLKLAANVGLDKSIGYCMQMSKLRKTTELLTLRKDSAFSDAYNLFITHGVQRIIITDSNGKLQGIVSRSNILRLMCETKAPATAA